MYQLDGLVLWKPGPLAPSPLACRRTGCPDARQLQLPSTTLYLWISRRDGGTQDRLGFQDRDARLQSSDRTTFFVSGSRRQPPSVSPPSNASPASLASLRSVACLPSCSFLLPLLSPSSPSLPRFPVPFSLYPVTLCPLLSPAAVYSQLLSLFLVSSSFSLVFVFFFSPFLFFFS